MRTFPSWTLLTLLVWSFAPVALAADSDDLHARVEASSGTLVEVPPGIHLINKALVLNKVGSGLVGFGTIVQTNPDEEIIRVENTSNVRLEGITLTRADGVHQTSHSALLATRSSHLTFRNVTIRNNRFQGKTLNVQRCSHVRIDGCEVINYKDFHHNDRTEDPNHGYAFRSLEGDGIGVQETGDVAVRNCTVAEYEMLPTKETAEKYNLGKLIEGRRPTKLGFMGERVVHDGRLEIWHQGSAFEMTGSGDNKHFVLTGNKAINAAQAFDLHLDYGVVSNNMIDHADMGFKVYHGTRNLVIDSNVISNVDLFGIIMAPGLVSHWPQDATTTHPAISENVDRGCIISNNIITDFGYGDNYWNWSAPGSRYMPEAIALMEGQAMDNPPLRDVLVTGNLVYNSGRDGIVRDNKVEYDKPRYEYAVYIGPFSREGKINAPLPRDIRFHGNLFEAGSRGITNTPVYLGD